MQASANYIYIVFAVVYIIYSIIKAGKNVTKNRPTVNPPSDEESTTKRKEEYKPVQPPVSSPVPNPGDELKKMLQEVLGKVPEVPVPPVSGKSPEKSVLKPKLQPVVAKPQPTAHKLHSNKKEKTASMQWKVKEKEKLKESASSNLQPKPSTLKVSAEPVVEQEAGIDFDIRQAIIFSEILKRPNY
ncbi:MAG TPA: hypothetical protein VII99_07985 [Bacteroidia bacterium]